jgi:CheY-like chemotaxis protein
MTLRLLVADDNVAMHKMVNLAFTGEDAVIEAVTNGDAALEMLKKFRPDAALIDVSMPGYSGYEVCELIRQDPEFSAIPVILLNGAFDPFDEEEAARVEANGHLTKPFDPSEMLKMVKNLVQESAGRPVPAFSGKKAGEIDIETAPAAEISVWPVEPTGFPEIEIRESASGKIPEPHTQPAAANDFFHVPPRIRASYLGPDSILEIFDSGTFDGKSVADLRIPDELIDQVAERVITKMFPDIERLIRRTLSVRKSS